MKKKSYITICLTNRPEIKVSFAITRDKKNFFEVSRFSPKGISEKDITELSEGLYCIVSNCLGLEEHLQSHIDWVMRDLEG